MAEIELNRETVQFLIDRVREFHTRDDVSFDEEPEIDDDDWSEQVSTSFASDPYYQEIKTTVDDLEPDQQMTLVALMISFRSSSRSLLTRGLQLTGDVLEPVFDLRAQ